MEGYQLSGMSYTTCLSNGSWSSAMPVCTQIKCPQIRPLPSGKTVEIFPGIVFYACNAGFKLVGTSASRCMANGSWSTSMPQCNPIQCFPFATPKNGTLVRSSWGVFGITEFACDEGYALKGQRSSVCREDGTWSSTEPSCEAIRCSQLAPPKNGTVVRSSLVLFGIIEFACNDGYALNGQRAAVCKGNETWSSKTPVCEEVIQCPKLGEPANGTIVRNSHAVLGVTEFACDEGYLLVGNSSSVCMSKGYWSSDAPKCQEIRCSSDLATPDHGAATFISNKLFDVITYSCNPGYQLIGDISSICLPSGNWSTATPSCESILCKDVPAVNNGSIISLNNIHTINATSIAVCNPGFHLYSNRTVQCAEDGSWDTTSLPDCRPLPNIPDKDSQLENGSDSVPYLIVIGCLGFIVVILVIIVIALFIRQRSGVGKLMVADEMTVLDNEASSAGSRWKQNSEQAAESGLEYGTIGDACSDVENVVYASTTDVTGISSDTAKTAQSCPDEADAQPDTTSPVATNDYEEVVITKPPPRKPQPETNDETTLGNGHADTGAASEEPEILYTTVQITKGPNGTPAPTCEDESTTYASIDVKAMRSDR
ncbi:P-selectin-like [Sycon ciliatum]|uniref:P-selectin-like n=1 Tax=Sycon ciliatum TaxID=27933 RepID=UPI0031F6951E